MLSLYLCLFLLLLCQYFRALPYCGLVCGLLVFLLNKMVMGRVMGFYIVVGTY